MLTGNQSEDRGVNIAIVGIACRFAGASNPRTYWKNICDGVVSVDRFSEQELEDWFDEETRKSPDYVKARPIIKGVDRFDAGFFGMQPLEAALIDPQHRVFLECAWEALEDAGYDPARYSGAIGVFAGCSSSTYFLNNICSDRSVLEDYVSQYQVGCYNKLLGAATDFLPTRVSYKLNLRGPSIAMHTACSTSLVATIQACQSLLLYQSDMAIAGGVSITFPQRRGYLHQEGGMVSQDGYCRPFDKDASGTIFGDGAGAVLLKRLSDAIADGDHIYAVVEGCGINNDGSGKAGFTAPSVEAQSASIAMAIADAEISARELGYVECHGTATPLGDPIEIAALSRAFTESTFDKNFCAVGSVKANIGHTDAAAGIAGLIKSALAVKHGLLPPVTNFRQANPQIDFENSPFFVNTALKPWPESAAPRKALVCALGVGGTNAHLVLREPPSIERQSAGQGAQILLISARDNVALQSAGLQLGEALESDPSLDLEDVAATLTKGRRHFSHRCALVVEGRQQAVEALKGARADTVAIEGAKNDVAFMFPGQGSQYVGMGQHLYLRHPEYRSAFDFCAEFLKAELDQDLRDSVFATDPEMQANLTETTIAQPALLSLEYALARLWMSWGLKPTAMIGHSLGEFTAACLAGVMSIEDCLRVVALRGKILQALPRGGMLAVRLPASEVGAFMMPSISIAAANSPTLSVLSGPFQDLEVIEGRLADARIFHKRLATSHAFHSEMVEPAVEPLRNVMAGIALSAPIIPFVSCVSGEWITDAQATSPDYWARHARETVAFAKGIDTLLASCTDPLLEVGPGITLSVFAAQSRKGKARIISSTGNEPQEEETQLLRAYGELWSLGAKLSWPEAFKTGRRVSLPTYPFQRVRHFIDAPVRSAPLQPQAKLANGAVAPAVNGAGQGQSATWSATPEEERSRTEQGDQSSRMLASMTSSVIEILQDLSGLEIGEDAQTLSFLEMGFDSLFLSQAVQRINKKFKVKVTFRRLLSDLSNATAVAAFLAENSPEAKGSARAAEHSGQSAVRAGRNASDGFAAALEDPRRATPSATPTESETARPSRFDVYARRKSASVALTPEQKRHIDQLTARFTQKTAKSKEQTQAYRRVLADPRAVQGFKLEWKELVYPLIVPKAKGSRLWDVDGNEYTDLVNGYGQTALGHTPDFVVEAVREQLEKGFAIGPQAELAGKVAELFTELTGTERITFCNTGSEAVMAAMRVARCVTGREKIVAFDGDYHGQFDEVLVRGVKGSSAAYRSLPIAPGIVQSAVENIVILDYGTTEALRWIEENADDLAGVMVEPVQSRHPKLQPFEFLKSLRDITERSGAALIIDEVVTGFRAHPGGIQGITGITADLATYGKVVGGGLPVGILAGKAKFMDALDGGDWRFGDNSVPEAAVTFFAGTFVRHPLVLSAVWAILNHLKAHGPLLQEQVAAKTAALVERLRLMFAEFGVDAEIEQFSSFFYFNLANEGPFAPLLYFHLRDRGIFIQDGFPCFLTTMHGDAEIDKIVAAFKDSLSEMSAVGLIGARGRGKTTETFEPTEPQLEIWLAAQLTDEASCAFNESITLRLKGNLDATTLENALNGVIARHDALRSRFSPTGEAISVSPSLKLNLPVLEAPNGINADTWLNTVIAEDASTVFDLVNGPLIRAKLLRLGASDHAFVLTIHHIVCDGWSFNTIVEELAKTYTGLTQNSTAALGEVLQFSFYAKQAVTNDADEAFWVEAFRTLPPVVDLPTDRPRPAVKSYKGASYSTHTGEEIYSRLKVTAASCKCTMFTLLFGAFKALVGRLANTNEPTIAVPFAGQALVEQQLVGHCVNFLPIRSAWTARTTVAEHLGQVGDAVADATDHQNFTLGTLIRKLNMPRGGNRLPLTDIQFNLDRLPATLKFADMEGIFSPNPKSFVNYDLFFNIIDTGSTLRLDCDYNSDCFDRATIERWLTYYTALLEAFCRDPHQPVAEASYLPVTARPADHAIDGPAMDYPRGKCIHHLFEAQAEAHPEATAVVYEDSSLTYGELDARANQLANYLLARMGGKGERIGVIVERSLEMVVALLAVLKAGCAYVPMDPTHPEGRLKHILRDARVDGVITNVELKQDLAPAGAPVVDLSRMAREIADCPPISPRRARSGSDLAHIIYTSGSTGKPKGAAIEHRSIVSLLTSMANVQGFGSSDVLFALTTVAFDIAAVELYLPLICGGKTVIAPSEVTKDGYKLLARIKNSGTTFLQATPSSWRLLIEAGFHSWRGLTMVTGGEPLLREVANRLLEGGGTLWNMYGPTETTIYSTAAQIHSGDDPITVGWPVANTQLYILDQNDQPMPPGGIGQLHIGGEGVARGYFDKPSMTVEKFIPNPFGPGRLYRTGDLSRMLPSGAAQLLGRVDNQIKLRGYRIELGEIEAALTDKGGVADAAAALRDVSGAPTLIAYWVDAKGAPKAAEELRATLAQDLPAYMIPTAWMRLDRLPRLPNGKLDRASLPLPSVSSAAHAEEYLPQTEMEKEVAAIWADVLKHAPILRTDDLLQLGADSIQVFQITARANKAGIALSAKDLFKHRSLAALAAFLAGQSQSKSAQNLEVSNRNSSLGSDYIKIDAERRFDQPRSSFSPSRTVKKAT